MLRRMTLALPMRLSRPSCHGPAYDYTRPRVNIPLVVLVVLSVLMAQGYVARPCPAMPFSDCAMAIESVVASAAVPAHSTQGPPCCPFQKMANCVGVGCYSIFMTPAGTGKIDAPLTIVGHWFAGDRIARVHPFSFNIFHPPRIALP